MTTPPPQTKNGNRFTVASLLSPPEFQRKDSFTSPMTSTISQTPNTSFSSERSLPASFQSPGIPRAYVSPPISPCTKVQKEDITTPEEEDNTTTTRDPVLFAPGDNGRSIVAPGVPLFPQDEELDAETESAITHHMASNDAVFRSGLPKPSRNDYRLSVVFRSKCLDDFMRNPKAYLAREIGFLKDYKYSTGISKHKKPTLKKLAPAPSLTSPSSSPRRMAPTSRAVRAPRPPRRSPQNRILDSFDPSASASSSNFNIVPKTVRAPTNRDDVDFNALPDFCPPLATLPQGNSKCLKVDWKGQPLDLSTDPNRSLLHEAELNVASTLRLSCATYLCSKRRIFQARLDALRIGKEFRKTDAQQACKIDVNKASKLWVAYEKVGWFDPKYFRDLL